MASSNRLTRNAYHLVPRQPYLCPSCLSQSKITRDLWHTSPLKKTLRNVHLPGRPQQPQVKRHLTSRHRENASCPVRAASSLVSSTAINAPSSIPPRYVELHQRLSKLQDEAAGYVDLSRLQLALKSLESEHATTRIAFLTLDKQAAISARRLARLLLSDPLGTDERWESELLSAKADESLLLRYGQPDDITGGNALAHTILVPSKFLLDNHIEILIAPLQSSDNLVATGMSSAEELLVPTIPIAASYGRAAYVRSPVHKAIVIGSGITGAVQIGNLRLSTSQDIISIVDSTFAKTKQQNDVDFTVVNTELASKALDEFRIDDSTGGIFGQSWLDSSIQDVADILTTAKDSAKASSVGLDYAAGLLDVTAETLNREEQRTVIVSQDGIVTEKEQVQTELQSAISRWSAESHRDLRDNLLAAFESRAWRRTAWWRLFWRVDDVTYSTGDILTGHWLKESEQTLAYISGRISQTGLASDEALRGTSTADEKFSQDVKSTIQRLETEQQNKPLAPEVVQLPDILARAQQEAGIDLLFNPPWPQTIGLARQSMLHIEVPAMHRKAQALLFATYTTIGGSAALGGWLWAVSTGSLLYEAGAVFALGLVWSLRRLQRRWGKDRDMFAATVQENGRKVLVDIESHLRLLVRTGGEIAVLSEDTERVLRAQNAIESCRQALQEARHPT